MRHGAINVEVGDGACMTVPTDLEWILRYGNVTEVRYTAASVVASFKYLIQECNQKEALRRLKLMREALKG